jgi:hypothetical protein
MDQTGKIHRVYDQDIEDNRSVTIGSETFTLPFTQYDRDNILILHGIDGQLADAIRGRLDDMDFMRLVRDHKRKTPQAAKAINSEEGATKEKQEEAERRRRTIEEAHRHDDIEDADEAVTDYVRRSRIYGVAAAVSLIALFIGLLTLTLVAWPIGLAITAPSALASAFTVTATAQRFNNNNLADKRARAKLARRKLRDFQT